MVLPVSGRGPDPGPVGIRLSRECQMHPTHCKVPESIGSGLHVAKTCWPDILRRPVGKAARFAESSSCIPSYIRDIHRLISCPVSEPRALCEETDYELS